jgi:outer membrane protein, heavy metal efflux system
MRGRSIQLALAARRLLPKVALVLVIGSLIGGCVLAPREAKTEQAALRKAGAPYSRVFEKRQLPDLPERPEWRDVLRRALLANGELEAAYFEWAASVARIDQAGGYPNTALSLDFEQMIEGGTFVGDTTVTVGADPMESLAFPPKIYQAGKVATDDARAAGKRFQAKKLDVQRQVLSAWVDYALLAERLRIQQQNLTLLKLINDTAVARVQAGAQQQDLLRAEVEYRRAQNELQAMEAEQPQMRAMLNAMLGRAPDAALAPPDQLPAPRDFPADDARLLALAADNNPELADLALQTKGRRDALELARLQLIPDFNPFAGFTGDVSQFVGLGLSIPTFQPAMYGMIKEARADLRRMQALYRQARWDRAARVVAALYSIRNSERQAVLFEQSIVPAAGRIVDNTRQAYAAGTGTFLDLVEAQRTLLEVRLTAVEARAAREKSLADLEALIGGEVASPAEQREGVNHDHE